MRVPKAYVIVQGCGPDEFFSLIDQAIDKGIEVMDEWDGLLVFISRNGLEIEYLDTETRGILEGPEALKLIFEARLRARQRNDSD